MRMTWLCMSFIGLLVSAWFCNSVSARNIKAMRGPPVWTSGEHKKGQRIFRSPEGAARELIEAMSANDEKKLLDILGPQGKKIVFSGKDVDEKAAGERFAQAYRDKNRIINVSRSRAVLEIGNNDEPFPLPIEKIDGHWRFSAKHVRVELKMSPEGQK